MTIGLPNAFLYHRYHRLWEVFFKALGCRVVTSGDTTRELLCAGSADAASECCLPAKIYLGHVRALIGACDFILVPHFVNLGKDEEFCVRFLGLYDTAANTYPGAPLLSYTLKLSEQADEASCFLSMGKHLKKSHAEIRRAYALGRAAQDEEDWRAHAAQKELLAKPGMRIFVAAQPYIVHDAYIGAPILRMICAGGGIPVVPAPANRSACLAASKLLSPNLYWSLNKEIIGCIPLHEGQIDGVILLTAFPCGSDSMVSELLLRKLKKIPVIQILLDDLDGDAGIQTRIESFLDILTERRRILGTSRHISPHGELSHTHRALSSKGSSARANSSAAAHDTKHLGAG